MHSGRHGPTEQEDDDSDDSQEQDPQPSRKVHGRLSEEDDKRAVKLDVLGYPNGRMMPVLADDVKRYAKLLDPTTSWEGQPSAEKKLFFKRLYRGSSMSITLRSFKSIERHVNRLII